MKPVKPATAGKVRIIAGRWRGSKLDVPPVQGLRPSSDRMRETLFNWWQGEVAGARCLDLFAGSGALGFEAASRGASRVTLIERDARALACLRAGAQRLDADGVLEIVTGDALAWLARVPDRRFDLAFVDPPFAAGLHGAALNAMLPWMAPRASIYVEAARDAVVPAMPGFSLRREACTRDVRGVWFARDACMPDVPATLG